VARRGPRKRTRTRSASFSEKTADARVKPLPPRVGKVHPNSMAARKLGRTTWLYGVDGGV